MNESVIKNYSIYDDNIENTIRPESIEEYIGQTDVKENIGMWSMYAQPWEEGVLVRLHKKVVKEWIRNIDKILAFNKDNYNDGNIYLKIQKNKYVSNYNNEDTILIIILCFLSIVIISSILIILKKVKKAQKV